MFLELKKQLPPVYNNKLIYNFSNNLYSLVEIPVGEKVSLNLNIFMSVFNKLL